MGDILLDNFYGFVGLWTKNSKPELGGAYGRLFLGELEPAAKHREIISQVRTRVEAETRKNYL